VATQKWCTGRVGMFGISWGGFSSLQVAARRPPALKAIITHCSTDDRYLDDAHYIGGCIVQDMWGWGSDFFTIQGAPPDPATLGVRWRDVWMDRLKHNEFRILDWVRHQTRDAFWKHGSIDEDYGDIVCPVYAIGGWTDAYNCAVPRMLAGLKVPRKGLIGAWSHNYPSEVHPGPGIDYLTEALRWWDHWLKDHDTGIMAEPMYRVWMEDKAACCGADEIPGRWVAEEAWPSSRITPQKHYLVGTEIAAAPGAETQRVLAPRQTVGMAAGHWCPFNMPTELPLDQAIDDGRSLTFDSGPLAADLELLGPPVATLDLAVDRPVAFLALRLNEVQPDGHSTRVSYAVLNLTHRASHEHPEALEPGKRYRIRVQMRDVAHSFKAGNRLRLAISTTYWPLIWPSPEPVRLTLFAGHSELELPVRPPRPEDASLRPLGTPYVPPDSGQTQIGEAKPQSKDFSWDVATGTLTIVSERPLSARRINAVDTILSGAFKETSRITDDDPLSATLEYRQSHGYARDDDWDTRVETVVRIGATKETFLVRGELTAFDHGKQVFTRSWNEAIPRQFV
ncbi:MAG TPA: CocE/NonD family hydrolase, partial [Stellaceae bacterium]|nr:CocE/NonD family hydrolase [Stellaceae bacterium]